MLVMYMKLIERFSDNVCNIVSFENGNHSPHSYAEINNKSVNS